jgi:hypothetical protein
VRQQASAPAHSPDIAPWAVPLRATMEVLCDGPVDARGAAGLGGFGQFGGVQLFGLDREYGAPHLSATALAGQKCDTYAPSGWQPPAGWGGRTRWEQTSPGMSRRWSRTSLVSSLAMQWWGWSLCEARCGFLFKRRHRGESLAGTEESSIRNGVCHRTDRRRHPPNNAS